jgi:hypothetical protein
MVEVTPPGGAAIDMAYSDATQDRRILAGDTRMAYNQLGLSSQGPAGSRANQVALEAELVVSSSDALSAGSGGYGIAPLRDSGYFPGLGDQDHLLRLTTGG